MKGTSRYITLRRASGVDVGHQDLFKAGFIELREIDHVFTNLDD